VISIPLSFYAELYTNKGCAGIGPALHVRRIYQMYRKRKKHKSNSVNGPRGNWHTWADLEIVEQCAEDACAQAGLDDGVKRLVMASLAKNDLVPKHDLFRLRSWREGGEYV
jgi:hypothetical protein